MTFPAFRCSMKWIRDRSLSTRALNLELPKYLILRRDEMRDDLRGVKLINLGVAFGLNEFPNLRKHTPEVFGYGFRRCVRAAVSSSQSCVDGKVHSDCRCASDVKRPPLVCRVVFSSGRFHSVVSIGLGLRSTRPADQLSATIPRCRRV
jgi:hypothetical protein